MPLPTIDADQYLEADDKYEDGAAADSFPYIYWRRRTYEDGTPGEIVVQGAWPNEFMNRIKEGWTPLPQFGEFQMKNAREPNDRGRVSGWTVMLEPYRRILLHPDGPGLFTFRQIKECGWHRKAPYRGIAWTDEQKAAMAAHTDFKCNLCGREFAEEVHLNKHQTVTHKESSSNEKLARALADAQGKGTQDMAGALGVLADVLKNQGAQLAQVSERQAESDARFERLMTLLGGQAAATKDKTPARA